MTTLRKVLPFVLIAVVALWTFTSHPGPTTSQVVYAQTPTACSFTYTFTGNATQAAVSNLSKNTPCVNWRITLSTTGSLSSTVTFNTSPDNSTWTAVPNTVCSSTVQPPCVLQGTNPIVGNQGMLYAAAYGNYVQVVVTSSSGTGTGTIRGYGAFGATAAGPSVGGGGGGGGTIAATTKPLKGDNAGNAVASAAADTVGLFSACSGIEYLGADGACHAAPSAPTAVAAMSNLTPVTVSANTTADQTLQEIPLTAGALNTLLAANLIHGSGYFTIAALQTPTLTFKAKLCTVSGCGSGTVVTLASITSGATVAATNNGWNLQLMAGTSAIGATGTLTVHGAPGLVLDLGALTGTAATPYTDLNTTVSSSIDLTAALFLDFTVATSAGNAGNSFTENIAEVLPQGGGGGGGGSTIAATAFNSLPVTCASGSLYLFTDTLYTQALCGASNTYLYQTGWGTAVPPPTTGWTTENAGGGTASANNGVWQFLGVALGGTTLAATYRTAPGRPFTVDAQIIGQLENSLTNYFAGAVFGVRDSAGKYITYAAGRSYDAETTIYYASTETWNSATSRATTPSTYGPYNNGVVLRYQNPLYWRMVVDSTNVTFYFSYDHGLNWVQFGSVIAWGGVLADTANIAFGVQNEAPAATAGATLVSWYVH